MLKVPRVGEVVLEALQVLAGLQELRVELQRRESEAVFQQRCGELLPVSGAADGAGRPRDGRTEQGRGLGQREAGHPEFLEAQSRSETLEIL